MTYRTVIPAAIILIAGGAAIAVAAGGDRHDGHAARHEARLDHMFEAFDLNADGKITRAEIEAGREARFAASDANGDGKLSEAELRAAMQKRAADRAERRLQRIMERADADKDGAISLAEYKDPPRHRGGKMFKRLDQNGDGAVTREEAEAAKGWRHGRKDDKKAD